jgi:hypothetical protein
LYTSLTGNARCVNDAQKVKDFLPILALEGVLL